MRIKWIAPAVAGALMTMPVPAVALTGAPLTAKKKVERKAEKREQAYRPVAVPAHLRAIAACESGGDPRAVSADGAYRGKYQFSFATWAAVGGKGDPAAASEAEQDMRAALLYARAGAGQWPTCGR